MNTQPIAYLETIKIVREHAPIMAGGEYDTMGSMIDRHLQQCAEAGQEVQEIKLAFNDEQWLAYATRFQPQPEPAYDDPMALAKAKRKPGY